MKILINDGIHPSGKKKLEQMGYDLEMEKVAQVDLFQELPKYDAISVRSATKIRKDLIDACPNLKVIGRGGVGLDNIDVDYARSKGIKVVNTPGASSEAVAELVFAHIFAVARSLHLSNIEMRSKGTTEFKRLKKSYAKGFQLRGKTLGIVGMGRIGQEVAKIGLGLGMNVLTADLLVKSVDINLNFQGINTIGVKVTIPTSSLDDVLKGADIISLHVPFTGKPLLTAVEFDKMKDGVVLVNAARGGVVDEKALLKALESGKVAKAGLDVFENEPTPANALLVHPKISISPHIGASTLEAQQQIGLDLADRMNEALLTFATAT